ncbi:molybdenum cofactor guanylyltransferase [Desulfobaculum senezii]
MPTTHHISIAILAGGRGERLGGVDKASLRLGGRTLLEHQLAVLTPLSTDILLVGAADADTGAAPIRAVPDLLPASGPLTGLHAALSHARFERILVVPCDAPFLHPALLKLLLNAAPHAPAVVPRGEDGFWHPLLAVYARAILPDIEALAATGVRQVVRLFDAVPAHPVSFDDLRRVDPQLSSFFNINTPGDLRDAENGIRHSDGPSLAAKPRRWS